MREIKFRAWNKETKKIIDLKKITPLALDIRMTSDWLFIPFIEDMILMQYTWLKDKNWKEIFEWDIIEYWSYTDIKEKEYIYYNRWRAWFCRTKWELYWYSDLNSSISSSHIIIWNIYENPELLK